MFLEKITQPNDIKNINPKDYDALADEIRQFLIEKISVNGGHLGSNLGAVELTMALHLCLNFPEDKIVWDVGHQAYAHKILTGRRDRFHTNRQFKGLCGFPTPKESEYDAFGTGHSSTSISAALGMAIAAQLKGEVDRQVVAVIGDGAMSGGLAFEGINNASINPNNLLIILNDNHWAIDPIRGGMSESLTSLHLSPKYNRLRWLGYKALKSVGLMNDKRKNQLIRLGNTLKSIKHNHEENNIFEGLNIRYFGPVDGHNVEQLVGILSELKRHKGPKVLHIITKKGNGYKPAEENVTIFHAPGAFNAETGERVKSSNAGKPPKFQDVFGETLLELAKQDERIVGITPAMPSGCSMNIMMKAMPNRTFDVGIAEGHAVTFSAGLAKEGLIPFCNIYSSFMQRGYDNVIHDVALQNLHVVFAVDRAGLVGADGETHHGVFDTGYLTQIPGMTVLCPSNFAELRTMLRRAVLEIDGPVAVRYPRGGEGSFAENCADCDLAVLRTGRHGTIVSYGTLINEAIGAADLLQRKNIFVSVIKLNGIAPLDSEKICAELWDGKPLLVAEECMAESGIGRLLPAVLAENRKSSGLLILRDLGSKVPGHGSVEQLRRVCGIDAQGIAKAFEEAYHEQ